jgi:NADH-quinone oxidoreductase subunit J
MLLDLKAEIRRRVNFPALCGGFVVIVLFVKVLSSVSYSFAGGNAKFQAISQGPQGDVWHVGMVLFQQYNIPLQVVGTLILVASIGVVILSKRELK